MELDPTTSRHVQEGPRCHPKGPRAQEARCQEGGQEEVDCEEAHARREEGQGGQGEAGLPLPDRGPEGLTSLYSILAIVIVVLNKLALIIENRKASYFL